MSTRDRSLDAAIDLLGTQGMRALTHRRVDAHAGLPPGSTSNWFRTRDALIQGVVERMVAVELPELSRTLPVRTQAELIDRVCEAYEFFVGRNRVVTSARLALIIEAAHDERIRAMLARGRAAFAGTIEAEFAAVGAPDPGLAAEALAACFEGLFLHEIGGHGTIDARRTIRLVVSAAISPR